MWGSPPATNTSNNITSTRGKSLTESQPETGRSSPIQPGLRDSHGTGEDREKTAGGDLYFWEETEMKREIIGSKQAKPQTRYPNSGVLCRIRILYTNIHYMHSHYIQKSTKRGLKT